MTYPKSTLVPMATDRRFWFESFVVKDIFRAKVEENTTETDVLFEQTSSSSEESVKPAPFEDHKEEEDILICPRSILGMRVESVEIC